MFLYRMILYVAIGYFVVDISEYIFSEEIDLDEGKMEPKMSYRDKIREEVLDEQMAVMKYMLILILIMIFVFYLDFKGYIVIIEYLKGSSLIT